MVGNKLIPGGEISLMPGGSYTTKEGKTGNAGPAIAIKFGKQYMRLRIDLAKALYEGIQEDEEIRRFIGV